MMVYQKGQLVGESPVNMTGSFRVFRGESVFVMTGDQQWQRASGSGAANKLHEDLIVPAGFAEQLRTVMRPGQSQSVLMAQ